MRDSFNEINITPLTDIFLVLLIIMMVIAPMLDQQGLNLAVPEVVDAKQVKQDSKILSIVITSSNTGIPSTCNEDLLIPIEGAVLSTTISSNVFITTWPYVSTVSTTSL